ncbi:S-methyl-5'-thioadenosine phosphorylase [Candidatus Binatia bacterium]|nr:S-methyl-5'-thioadenosine phosphorylase [Candidatus Binatia bacterium]
MPGLHVVDRVSVSTPFGAPSDDLVCGTLNGQRLVFLPRHGVGHRKLPTEVNYRANIFAMKQLGVEWLIGVASVGSLREEIAPGHFVVPDQMIDRTVHRPATFFGNGIVVHVGLSQPVCPVLTAALAEASGRVGMTVHDRGTYICMEGPQFSTRAESLLYRQWGADIIGMTAMQEARLAREAEMCFAVLALATDYDCWREETAAVAIGDVLRILKENVANAQRTIGEVAPRLTASRTCGCVSALAHAIITERSRIPAEIVRDLAPLIGKYVA